MATIKLILAYDGNRYSGWQTQNRPQSIVHGPRPKTIQEEIEKALEKVFKKKIRIEASGRTDAGVHAVAQVAHFALNRAFDLKKLPAALNAYLPSDILVSSAKKAPARFHARFDAEKKLYRYCVVNTAQRPLFVSGYAAWVRHPLDVKKMRRAARCLLGRHDFRSFQATDRVPRRSVTTVSKIRITRPRGCSMFPFMGRAVWILVDIEASGFLRNMVRNIVGTLIEVGRGRLDAEKIGEILRARDRRAAGPCAPAQGLYLMEVHYDRAF